MIPGQGTRIPRATCPPPQIKKRSIPDGKGLKYPIQHYTPDTLLGLPEKVTDKTESHCRNADPHYREISG